MAEKLGWECKAYHSPTDLDGDSNTPATLADWDEITKARDVAIDQSDDEVDATSRANSGDKATLQGLRDRSISFDILWDTDDTDLVALKTAYLARNTIAMAFMDGDIETGGSEGLCGNFSITEFNRGEGLADAVAANITVKLYSHGSWYVVAGS